jgi:hypothetical protein
MGSSSFSTTSTVTGSESVTNPQRTLRRIAFNRLPLPLGPRLGLRVRVRKRCSFPSIVRGARTRRTTVGGEGTSSSTRRRALRASGWQMGGHGCAPAGSGAGGPTRRSVSGLGLDGSGFSRLDSAVRGGCWFCTLTSSWGWDWGWRRSGGVMGRWMGEVSSGGSCGAELNLPPPSNHATPWICVDQSSHFLAAS